MKTQYYTASSLDGFIADPNDSLDWLFPLGDIADTSYPTFIRDVGAIAMGARTYEWLLRHMVGPEADRPEPWPYRQPVWVFTSRTLRGRAWRRHSIRARQCQTGSSSNGRSGRRPKCLDHGRG